MFNRRLRMLERNIGLLQEMEAIQNSPGNFSASEYMRGMANGLTLALSLFTGEEPRFHEPPDKLYEGEIHEIAQIDFERMEKFLDWTEMNHPKYRGSQVFHVMRFLVRNQEKLKVLWRGSIHEKR